MTSLCANLPPERIDSLSKKVAQLKGEFASQVPDGKKINDWAVWALALRNEAMAELETKGDEVLVSDLAKKKTDSPESALWVEIFGSASSYIEDLNLESQIADLSTAEKNGLQKASVFDLIRAQDGPSKMRVVAGLAPRVLPDNQGLAETVSHWELVDTLADSSPEGRERLKGYAAQE